MRKHSFLSLLLVLLALTGAAWASESHSFRLGQDAQLQSVDLKAGKYTIRLNGDDQAEILHNGKVVVTASVDVQPLSDKARRNSVLIESGKITEIRLKNHLIVIKNG